MANKPYRGAEAAKLGAARKEARAKQQERLSKKFGGSDKHNGASISQSGQPKQGKRR
jgi:hypothetical protein